MPIRQGAGWSWGARSRDRAFYIGLGVGSYVGPEGWASKKDDDDFDEQGGRAGDLERGRVNGNGNGSAELTGPGLEGGEMQRGM